MDLLATLDRPVVASPMAGGPSTPALAAAVSAAGGLGFLAAGYKTPDAVRDQIWQVRELTGRPFGVNVFVPTANDERESGARVAAYRSLLQEQAQRRQVTLPEPNWTDTDHWQDKLDVLLAEAVPVVSFTFGCPSRQEADALHRAGSLLVVTVTDADEARAAEAVGADALSVQGTEAGGHRSTHEVGKDPNDTGHLDLLREVRAVTALPLVAAGGIVSAEQVRAALAAGAGAVQVGTALLRTPEAGTSEGHRRGLVAPALGETVVTRAFSGRPARGLRNGFIEAFGAQAPAVFPIVDQLTKPLRAQAAQVGDLDGLSLWAGTGWRETVEAPAAEVVRALSGD